MQFTQGQIIPIVILNQIDAYINQLRTNPEDTVVINNLIAKWDEIPNSNDDNNIQDDIDLIIAKQNSYIGEQ